MAPILIDKRDLVKLGLFLVVTIVLAFAAGFKIGKQQAMFSLEHPMLPATISTVEDESSTYPVNSIESDAADRESEQVVSDNRIRAVDDAVPPQTRVAVKSSSAKADGNKSVSSAPERKKQEAALSPKSSATSATASTAPSNKTTGSEIKYSIQVAVYGQLANAGSMMEKLRAKGIDAYVTYSVNKNNKKWFNVRFGRFKDKRSAQKALQSYIKQHKGDGYLVNYSTKNLIDLTKPENIRKSLDTIKKVTPKAAPKVRQTVTTKEVPVPVRSPASADNPAVVPGINNDTDSVSQVDGNKPNRFITYSKVTPPSN
jgi:cell division septation protein DedD